MLIKIMAEIQIISTTIVSSQHPTNKKINLTSSDLKFLLTHSIQWGLLFPKPNPSFPQNSIQHLKSTLSRTLDFYFPLAGRLSATHYGDSTVSFAIDCNNAGALFVHAVAQNVAVSDVLEPFYVSPVFHSFFALTGVKNAHGIKNPLLGIQVTELTDGIFVGVSMNHAIADGSTFWNFMKSWSEVSRGVCEISKPPVFDNWFRDRIIRFPISILDTEEYNPPPLAERILNFSKEKLGGLKTEANTKAGVESAVVSTLQALSTHLWRSVVRARELKPKKDSKFTLYIGYRRRLKIPDGYFGNAVYGETVRLKAGEVVEEGVGFVALQLNKLVSGYTKEKAKNDIDSWVKDPEKNIPNRREIATNALTISSSPRFDVYGNDFGWGKPIAVRSGPGNRYDGKMTVFEGFEEGSIEVQACLSPRVLQALLKDEQFMDAVTA